MVNEQVNEQTEQISASTSTPFCTTLGLAFLRAMVDSPPLAWLGTALHASPGPTAIGRRI